MNINIENNYGGEILNIYNHNEIGNPHTQYIISDKKIAISPYDLSGKYFKLLSVEIEDLEALEIQASYFEKLQEELKDLKESDNSLMGDILLKENQLQEEGYKAKHDYNSNFEIIFDVYENMQYQCNTFDNAWKLFFKVTHSYEFYPKQVQAKLIGSERRAIVTVSESFRKEEYRYLEFDIVNDEIVQAGYKVKTIDVPVLVYDLYIVLNKGYDISFVKRFLDSSTENYKIYDKGKCRDYIPKTKDEIEFLNTVLEWYKGKEEFSKEAEKIKVALNNSNENIINKLVSKTGEHEIYIPSVPNYFERFIELFEININFEEMHYTSYTGIWELVIKDGKGAIEFRTKNMEANLENHKSSYIKFMIFTCNQQEVMDDGTKKNKYIFEFEVLEYRNVKGKKIYIKDNCENGKYGIWVLCDYPQEILLKPCIDDIKEGEFNRLRLSEEARYIGFTLDNTNEVSWDEGKYYSYYGID